MEKSLTYGLREDEQRFVEAFLKSADPAKAAAEMGKRPSWGREVYNRPAVKAAIHAAIQEAKQLLAAKAMIIVGEIMDDPRAGARTRLDAAKFMIEQGLGKATEAPRLTDPEELQARINERLKSLGLDAKVIDGRVEEGRPPPLPPGTPVDEKGLPFDLTLRKYYKKSSYRPRRGPRCRKSQTS